MGHQQAELTWKEGDIPVSTRFDDPYFSLADGLEETRHVFLGGNDLPARFCDGFAVGELGFGTGLNFLASLAAWREAGVGGRLRFTSFEAFPMDRASAARALAAFPEAPAEELLETWPAIWDGPVAFDGGVTLEVLTGDARERLPRWAGRADAWFFDGFAPARNPELWEPALLAEVTAHTRPNGTAATYSAAGHVRRALEAAGFAVTRAPGFGRKRHMTRARLI